MLSPPAGLHAAVPCLSHGLLQNPKQDVMVDPVRGPVKYQGESPGHKVAMRPADQVGRRDIKLLLVMTAGLSLGNVHMLDLQSCRAKLACCADA
jgi:hypothetical protein